MRKSKKELEALRGWLSKDKTPYKGGIARRLRMIKKKVGKKATKWQDNGKRSNIWRTYLIERRGMEGSSLKLDVMQKVPELVVTERMSQGEKVKDPKEKKKVPGWSIEEMKERPDIAVEEDTGEMKRGSPGQVQSRRGNSGAFKGSANPLEWKRVRRRINTNLESGEKIAVPFLQRLQSQQDELGEEEMKQQQRMATMKDLINKIRSKGSMDAQNRWWVAELLVKDCEKAWTHTGWEDTMQKWF